MFIELHEIADEKGVLINVDDICRVRPYEYGGVEIVFRSDAGEFIYCYAECYDNVKKVIEDAFNH